MPTARKHAPTGAIAPVCTSVLSLKFSSPVRYTIVIPVLNQLKYTQLCVDSLIKGGVDSRSLLVIDNGSTDETPNWLDEHVEIPSLRNRVNVGCGGAWTQGSLHGNSDWVILLNNDVVLPSGAIDRLLDAADKLEFDVVSPSLVEGPLDYDLESHTRLFCEQMTGKVRPGWFHGVCFAVRRQVFETIGFPDTDRRLGGREDVEYLVRCLRQDQNVGTVGDALLHHFGSITQKMIKLETGLRDLGDRNYFYRKLGMNWLERKRFKYTREQKARAWVRSEIASTGYSMHMQRHEGQWSHAKYL